MQQQGGGSGTPDRPAGTNAEFDAIRSEMQRVLAGGDALPALGEPDAAAAVARQAAEDIATLSRRVDQSVAATDDQISRLIAVLQHNAAGMEALSARVDRIERRGLRRFLLPLFVVAVLGLIISIAMVAEEGGAPALLNAIGTAGSALMERMKLLSGERPHADSAPTPAPPGAPPASETAATPAAAPSSTPPPPAAPPPAETSVAAAAAPEPAPGQPPAPPVPVAEAPPPAPPAAAAAPAAAPATADAAPPASPTATSAAAAPAIVLQANADTWVQVRNAQKATLLERLMHTGEIWRAPDEPGLTLTTGNAGGLTVLVGGTPAPSLGGTGAVRRDVPLDPHALLGKASG